MKLFLGIDLAWGNVHETGVVALRPDGTVPDAGWTVGLEATVAWIEQQRAACPDLSCFVDAPLVVNNAGGTQRLCETAVGKRYGHPWKISANSTNVDSPHLGGVRLRERLEPLGWTYSDGTAGPARTGAVMMECYPYTTTRPRNVNGIESNGVGCWQRVTEPIG